MSQETFPRVFDDNSRSIGNTPLVRIRRVLDGANATVLAKIEGRNPAYSVKCRIGAAIVWDAEKRGLLGPGKRVALAAGSEPGRAILVAGKPLREPIAKYGPFVMNTEMEIVQAIRDYQAGKF